MTAATSALAPQFASCQAAAFWQPGLGLLLGSVFGRCTAISASLQTRDVSRLLCALLCLLDTGRPSAAKPPLCWFLRFSQLPPRPFLFFAAQRQQDRGR
ncbi:hypothetical protein M440DRAFT_1397229 [Trichoderma longibrachiatum ATCC 18648]|uniref:Uncharacterized protein n=1 Tax=Trichoderma longibrachiatum ATCC 18648 TaxID=983965 RepID=A0A2T4CEH0_TRILO|nr:hypothetical protein M440DRAFT_1397229 [Trichoderma longibrachiatum ATCC 18648]